MFRESSTDSKHWIAHCLEKDIGSAGATSREAIDNLMCAIRGHVIMDARDGIQPLSAVHEAPREYWDRWSLNAVADDNLKARREVREHHVSANVHFEEVRRAA